MALNPQFPNYANGPAGTEIIGYTLVNGLPLYRLPVRMVETGFGAAMVAGGSSIYSPDDDAFAPPRIVSPGSLEGIFIEGETITHTPPLIEGFVLTQFVTWYARKPTGTAVIAQGVDTYTLQASDVGAFIYVEVVARNDYGEDQDTTSNYGPVLPDTVPVPVLTATFTPSTEVGTDAVLEITACTNGTVTKVEVYADRAQPIQTVNVTALPVTVTQGGNTLVPYIGQYITFKVSVNDGAGNTVAITYSCGPIVGAAPVITGNGEITGNPNAGETLTFVPPTVAGTPAPTVVYSWYRTGSGAVIASGLTYVATDDDLGKFLYVTTTATNILGGDTATSEQFGPILGTVPEITDPGVLSPDNVSSGGVITLDPIPTATGNPTPSVSWFWRDGVDEDRVLQLGGTTYKAKDTDIGTSIVVESRAINLSGEVTALSNEVSVDTAPPAVVTPSQLLDLTPAVRQEIGGVKAVFSGYPAPVITSFGFWDYTNPLSPVQLVDGENVTTYDVKDSDFGKEIAFVTTAQNQYGSITSVSTVSAPVSGFLEISGPSQLNWTGTPLPGTVLKGEEASFIGVPNPTLSQIGFATDNGDGTYSVILPSVGSNTYTVQTSDIGTSIVFFATATNAANPTGLTSYSNSTGTIQGPFEFLSNGSITIPGGTLPAGEIQTISVSSGGSYIYLLGSTRAVTITGDGVGAAATANLATVGNVFAVTIADGSSTVDGSGTITLTGTGSETPVVISWATLSGASTIDPNTTFTGGVGWTQADLDACVAGTYGTISFAGDPITQGASYALAGYIEVPVTSITITSNGSNYTTATATVDADPSEVGFSVDATLLVTVSTGGGGGGGGSAPTVGDILTLDYAVTNPRNQKNTPPGNTVLSWIWVRSDAPTVSITTPNAETYTVLAKDYGYKFMVVWTATAALDGDKIYNQTPYTEPVGGDAPAVLTSGVITGDANNIGSTATYTPATFSGDQVTVSWVWKDLTGFVWQTGGLTLVTTQDMVGMTLVVAATATNFAGSVTDTTPNFGPIGAGCVPFFGADGFIASGGTDYPGKYELLPAIVSTPGNCQGAGESILSYRWGYADDAAGTNFVAAEGWPANVTTFDSSVVPYANIVNKYVIVQSFGFNEAGTTGPVYCEDAVGPIGDKPTVVNPGKITGFALVGQPLTLSPIPSFQGDPTPDVVWDWCSFDSPGGALVRYLQRGGTQFIIPDEEFTVQGKYIGVTGVGTNVHGEAFSQTNYIGPVVKTELLVIDPGSISGLFTYDSVAYYTGPTWVAPNPNKPAIQIYWEWYGQQPGQDPVLLQNNGYFLYLSEPLTPNMKIFVRVTGENAAGETVVETANTPYIGQLPVWVGENPTISVVVSSIPDWVNSKDIETGYNSLTVRPGYRLFVTDHRFAQSALELAVTWEWQLVQADGTLIQVLDDTNSLFYNVPSNLPDGWIQVAYTGANDVGDTVVTTPLALYQLPLATQAPQYRAPGQVVGNYSDVTRANVFYDPCVWFDRVPSGYGPNDTGEWGNGAFCPPSSVQYQLYARDTGGTDHLLGTSTNRTVFYPPDGAPMNSRLWVRETATNAAGTTVYESPLGSVWNRSDDQPTHVVNAGNLTVKASSSFAGTPGSKYTFTLTTNQLPLPVNVTARPDTFQARPTDGGYNSTDLVYELLLFGIDPGSTPIVNTLTVVNNVATFEWPYNTTFTCYAQARVRLTGSGNYDTTDYAYSQQIKLNPYHYANYSETYFNTLNASTAAYNIPDDAGYQGQITLYDRDGVAITNNVWQPGCYLECVSPSYLPYGRTNLSYPQWSAGSWQLIRAGVGLQSTDAAGKSELLVLPLPSRYNVQPTVMSSGPAGTPAAGTVFRYYPTAAQLGGTFNLVVAPYFANNLIPWSQFAQGKSLVKLDGVTFKKPLPATAYRINNNVFIPRNPDPTIFWNKEIASYTTVQYGWSGPYASIPQSESNTVPGLVIDKISTDNYELDYLALECACPWDGPSAGCTGVFGTGYNIIDAYNQQDVDAHKTIFWVSRVRLYRGTPQESTHYITSPTLGMPGNNDIKLPPPAPTCTV